MNETVWLIADNAGVREPLPTMLRIIGFECREFEDARAPAHALLVEDPPNLLIIDLNLPVVDGLDLFNTIRRNPRWVHLPVILLSSERDEEQVMRMGADGYILKPVTIDELERTVRSAIKRRRAVVSQ